MKVKRTVVCNPHDLQNIVNELRARLATETECAFGALFVGYRHSASENRGYGFVFAEKMPHEARMSLQTCKRLSMNAKNYSRSEET